MKNIYILLSVLMMLAVGYVKADDNVVKVVNTTVIGSATQNVAATELQSANVSIEDEPTYTFVDGVLVMTLGDATNQIAKVPMKNDTQVKADYGEAKSNTTGTVSNVGYSTFYSPFQLKVPANSSVEVYAPVYDKDNSKLLLTDHQLVAGTVIPACTGLILKKAGDCAFEFSTGESDDVTSVLKGSVVAEPVSTFSGTIYSLSNKDIDDNTVKIGFYQYDADYTRACKAFLLLDTEGAALAKGVLFDIDEETTGIADIEKKSEDNANAYNLAGQRVKADAKGIVIINGKKYINR